MPAEYKIINNEKKSSDKNWKPNSHCLIIILPRIVIEHNLVLNYMSLSGVIRSLGWDKIILCLCMAAITSGYNDGQYNDQV